jgi:3-methyl-2-oxobutanoate hydroxymethyltransferase
VSKITIQKVLEFKNSNKPFATLTAYDFTSAKIVDSTGIPIILVGDSAAMVMLGYENTLPITMNDMAIFVKAVSRGAKNALIVADMPFMSYQTSAEFALTNAGFFIKECNASAVKLEGGKNILPQISTIIDAGIPVMGHLGLTPQSVHQMSGYKIQGKDENSAKKLIEDALAIQKAGAFSIVLEGIPTELAKIITKKLDIPTIGIGAGPFCDGQIQVYHDILGLDNTFNPKHAKQFANIQKISTEAINTYINEVESNKFPSPQNSTKLNPKVLKNIL